MKPTTQRAIILEAVKNKISEISKAKGIALRKVTRAAWIPGESMRPSAVVNDDGATKSSANGQDDTTKIRTLRFQVVLNLAADFGKETDMMDWTEHVENLCIGLQNFNPKAGVRYMNVLDDTPVKIELGSVSEHLWVIQCECEYFVEVQAFA
jgi:hypothetical protein